MRRYLQCNIAVLSPFNDDFGHTCLFDELVVITINELFNILLGLLSVILLPICWLFVFPFAYLMEHIWSLPAILQTLKQKILFAKKHHMYAGLATISGCIWSMHQLMLVSYFHLFAVPLVSSYFKSPSSGPSCIHLFSLVSLQLSSPYN